MEKGKNDEKEKSTTTKMCRSQVSADHIIQIENTNIGIPSFHGSHHLKKFSWIMKNDKTIHSSLNWKNIFFENMKKQLNNRRKSSTRTTQKIIFK